MKICADCGKKATWKCAECESYMCFSDSNTHVEFYSDHTTIKCKKIIPLAQSKISHFLSKFSGPNHICSDIIESDSLLVHKITTAQNAALVRIDQERHQLLNFITSLNKELTEEQSVEIGHKLKEIQLSFLLYQTSAFQISEDFLIWYQGEMLEERDYFQFLNTEDTDEFQINQRLVLIKSPKLPFVLGDVDYLKLTSQYNQRETLEKEKEKERKIAIEEALPVAKEIYRNTSEIKRKMLDLRGKVVKCIKDLSSKIANITEIMHNPHYIPPPNSLESEFSIFYKIIQESFDILQNSDHETLINFIHKAKAEEISKVIDTLNHTIMPHLQQNMESCKGFVAFLEEYVIKFFENYQDMKVSSDRNFYFFCE